MQFYVGVYDPFWVLISSVLLVPAMFVAISREALYRFSRKALLEKVPPAEQEKIEESLSFRDEYQRNLEGIDFVLRLLLVLSLAFGRWSELTSSPDELVLGAEVVNLLLLAGEILLLFVLLLHFVPSVIARVAAEGWLLRFLHVIDGSYRATAVMRVLWERVGRIGAFLFGVEKERTSADIVEEEILSAVEEGQREGLLKTRDIDMIESIMSYGDVEVSEVMTPRTEMVALDVEESLESNLEKVIECGHSRIPVYRGTKDRIIGVLYVKDLQKYLLQKEIFRLEDVVRRPYLVSEKAKIGELLQDFKSHRQHLAIVQDEHGGTAGLVTIEDILEEIVGEIADEYEPEETPVQRVGADVVEVDASVHIDDLNDQLGVSIPEGETYDTVGGYLFETMGKVPAVGDTLDVDGVVFEVIDADERRVHRLRLYLPDRRSQGAQEGAVRH